MTSSGQTSGIITLLTDFGQQDWYVGVMKGVILGRCPACTIVDITHEIPPGEISQGAFALLCAYSYFPQGTVHLAVVDPGVGGKRRPLAAQAGGHWFVGPDNGILDPALRKAGAGVVRIVSNEGLFLHPVSSTFHGRDVFAPVAAYLAGGARFESMGPAIRNWARLQMPLARWTESGAVGEIVYVDRFGNGVTNLEGARLIGQMDGADFEVIVGDQVIRTVSRTYTDVPHGKTLALIGSSGYLEISVRGGNAGEVLALRPGRTRVWVRRAKGKKRRPSRDHDPGKEDPPVSAKD